MEKKNPGRLMFSFRGTLVAKATTERGWSRFTALELFKQGKGYLLHIIGGSPNPDEDERHRYIRCRHPKEVVQVLRTQRSQPHSDVALELLHIARTSDPDFRRDWEERHGSGKAGSGDEAD